MKEIDLNSLSQEDADALDRLLSACAEAAVKEAQRKVSAKEKRFDGVRNACIALEFEDEGMDLLFACYSKSKFAQSSHNYNQHVKKRLASELAAFLPTEKLECVSLLLPIMVYVFIINNEYNYDTVRKRTSSQHKKDNQSSSDDGHIWGHTDPFTIYRSTKPPKLAEINKLRHKFAQAYENADDEGLRDNLGVIEAVSLLMDCESIIKLQDLGRIALFLLQIIVDSFDPNKPMETLVRFYLANRLDNILIRCSNFPVDIFRDAEEQVTLSNILLRYCLTDEPVDKKPLGVEIPDGLNAMGFDDLYHKLVTEFTISRDSLNDLRRFFLDPYRLEEMCTLWDRSKDFINAIIKDLNSCAQTTKRTAKWDLAMISQCIWQKQHERTNHIELIW